MIVSLILVRMEAHVQTEYSFLHVNVWMDLPDSHVKQVKLTASVCEYIYMVINIIVELYVGK